MFLFCALSVIIVYDRQRQVSIKFWRIGETSRTGWKCLAGRIVARGPYVGQACPKRSMKRRQLYPRTHRTFGIVDLRTSGPVPWERESELLVCWKWESCCHNCVVPLHVCRVSTGNVGLYWPIVTEPVSKYVSCKCHCVVNFATNTDWATSVSVSNVFMSVVVTWSEGGDCRPWHKRTLCRLTSWRGLSLYLWHDFISSVLALQSM